MRRVYAQELSLCYHKLQLDYVCVCVCVCLSVHLSVRKFVLACVCAFVNNSNMQSPPCIVYCLSPVCFVCMSECTCVCVCVRVCPDPVPKRLMLSLARAYSHSLLSLVHALSSLSLSWRARALSSRALSLWSLVSRLISPSLSLTLALSLSLSLLSRRQGSQRRWR